jgi:hypothetical protein
MTYLITSQASRFYLIPENLFNNYAGTEDFITKDSLLAHESEALEPLSLMTSDAAAQPEK